MTALYTVDLTSNRKSPLGPQVRNFRRGLISSVDALSDQRRQRLKIHKGSIRMVCLNDYAMLFVHHPVRF